MSTTLPVPNQQSAIANVKGPNGKVIGQAFLIPPWNSWFQQFSQKAPAVADVATPSPFTANANGTLILTAATTIALTRGTVTIDLTGQRIIPISIGDSISWTGPATLQFLGA